MSDENFFSDLVPAEKPAAQEESTGGAGYFDELVPAAKAPERSNIAGSQYLEGLTPSFRDKVERWSADVYTQTGYTPKIISGHRSIEEQTKLYERHLRGGPLAAPPGRSYHNFGSATDISFIDPSGKTITDEENPDLFRKMHKSAEAFGIKGIGESDPPHFQDADYAHVSDIPRGVRQQDVLGGRLAGKENAFIEAGIKHGIDPKFLMAVSMFETGNGTSDMVRTKNNVAGITDHSGQTYRTFGSVDDSIDYMASNLKLNYLDKGLNTIAQVGAKYAPPGASNDPNRTNAGWPNAVAANYQKLSSPEIQRRIAEFPAIAGEPTAQAVSEAGKAGETGAGFFSDLVPKKAEAGKEAPPTEPGAEDAGIFADLVPRQPVKIEEPTPRPDISPAPAAPQEEEPPSLPTIDLGAAPAAPQPAAAAPQPGLPAPAAEEQQLPVAAPQPAAPIVAAGVPPAPPGFPAGTNAPTEPTAAAPYGQLPAAQIPQLSAPTGAGLIDFARIQAAQNIGKLLEPGHVSPPLISKEVAEVPLNLAPTRILAGAIAGPGAEEGFREAIAESVSEASRPENLASMVGMAVIPGALEAAVSQQLLQMPETVQHLKELAQKKGWRSKEFSKELTKAGVSIIPAILGIKGRAAVKEGVLARREGIQRAQEQPGTIVQTTNEALAKAEQNVPPETTTTAAEPAAQGPSFVTSTKNAVVDAERQARGLSPILDEAVQSNQATMAAAEARLAANPDYGRALVADLVAGTKKSIEAVDEAVLLREKIKTQNERALAAERSKDPSLTDSERALATERFQEAENYISDIDLATYRSGQNWGRMGQFRQRLARDDYSLVTMESRMRISKGNKPLTPDELATLQKQVKDLEKAQGKRQAKEQRDLEATRERLERRVAQMKGLEPAAIKAKRLSVDDLEIEILRTELAKVKERLFEVRRLPKAKERVAKQIQEIEHRIQTYGYAERFRREALKPDRELRELQYRERQAKETLNRGLVDARWKNQERVQRYIKNVFRASTLPRALRSSMDLSYLLRQGKIMLMSRPLTTIRTFGESLKAGFGTRYGEALAEARTQPGGVLGWRRPFQIFNAASKRGYEQIQQSIRDDPHYYESKYEGGVAYTEVEPNARLSQMEEAYQSAWADAIPGVRESQRAYVAFLNKLRLESYKALKVTLGNNGEFTPIQAKIAGNYVNIVTGRGNLKAFGQNFEQASAAMAQVFWAPRNLVSRFQYIGGQPLVHLIHTAEGRTADAMRMRAVIAGEYARAAAGYSVYYSLLLGAAKAFGGQPSVELNPYSSDWSKIRIGNTRIDPWAGMAQVTTFLARTFGGKTTTQAGETRPIRGPGHYGQATWTDVAKKFTISKLAPLPGTAVALLEGQTFTGQPVTVSNTVSNLIVPLSASDMIDTMKEQGFTPGAALTVLSLLGEGIQTYSPTLTKTPAGVPMMLPPPPAPPPPVAPPPPPPPPM